MTFLLFNLGEGIGKWGRGESRPLSVSIIRCLNEEHHRSTLKKI